MLVWVFFFYLVKNVSLFFTFEYIMKFLWKTDTMLCALQVVALLICCFPNNSRFFYFASVFVASCYLLAKTKQVGVPTVKDAPWLESVGFILMLAASADAAGNCECI